MLWECDISGNQTWRYILCRFKTSCWFRTGRNKHSPTVICAAITSKMNKAKLPTHVEIDSCHYDIVKDSVILLEQLRTIDKKRLKDKVCHLDNDIIGQVDKALSVSLEMNHNY